MIIDLPSVHTHANAHYVLINGGTSMNTSPFEPLSFPEGKVAFAGNVRVNEEGVDEFWIELPGQPKVYGAWASIFEENGNDFNVEIIVFGYLDKYNVGNRYPGAQRKFTSEEFESVKTLIRELFVWQYASKNISPFNSKKAVFLGNVSFRQGWILIVA